MRDDEFEKRTRMLTLRDGLDRLAASLDPTGAKMRQQTVVSRTWEHIAGPAIDAHVHNVFLRGHILVVWVDSPIWATELSALEPGLRERFKEEAPEIDFDTFRFQVKRARR